MFHWNELWKLMHYHLTTLGLIDTDYVFLNRVFSMNVAGINLGVAIIIINYVVWSLTARLSVLIAVRISLLFLSIWSLNSTENQLSISSNTRRKKSKFIDREFFFFNLL